MEDMTDSSPVNVEKSTESDLSFSHTRSDINGSDMIPATIKKGWENDTSGDYRSKWPSSHPENNNDSTHDELLEDLYTSDVDDDDLTSIDDLPIFADDECKKIHRQTKIKEKKKNDAKNEVDDHKERISIMRQHLQNVRQEIDVTNGLLAAKNKELDTEEHLKIFAEREKGVISSDTKSLGKEFEMERSKLKTLQSQIRATNEESEKLKIALNWNQEELEQWATAASKREEDNLALEKYTRSDEIKIKELTLKIESVSKVLVQNQSELVNEATATQTSQIELDKTAEHFRTLHVERKQMIEQWKQVVDSMKSKDKEINNLAIRYSDVKNIDKEQKKTLAVNRKKEEKLNVRFCFELVSNKFNLFHFHMGLPSFTHYYCVSQPLNLG